MEVSFYLKRKAEAKTAVFARISYYGQQFKYYPGERIESDQWDFDKQRAKHGKNKMDGFNNFNRRLDNIVRYAEDILRDYQNDNDGEIPSPTTLKGLLDKKVKKVEKEKVTFFSTLDTMIENSKSGVRVNQKDKQISPNTIKTYVTVKNRLLAYQKKKGKKIDFETINSSFYENYKEYLMKDAKFSSNTIGKHFSIIKVVMNIGTDGNNNTNLDFKKKSFKVLKEEVDSIYLNQNELLLLENLDLSDDPKLENVRDMFLLASNTGLRYSDLVNLKPENIGEDGIIKIKQIKTGDRVSIPINKTVRKILDKNNGQLPKAISGQKFNEYLKLVGAKLDVLKELVQVTITKGGQTTTTAIEKYKLLTSHCGRRSFATNYYKAGTPIQLIMSVTGHSTHSSFMQYIKMTEDEKTMSFKVEMDKMDNAKQILTVAATQ